MTEAANDPPPPRVSGQDHKKNCPLSELIRLHDLEDSTLSQDQKKNNKEIYSKYIPDIPHSATDIAAFIEKYFLKL